MKKFLSILILFSMLFVQNSAFAIQKSDISVIKTPIVLNSKLKKDFLAYEYTITNEAKSNINIVNSQLINGVDGAYAYSTVEAGGGKSVGVLWLVCGPAGLFTFGIGWLVGIVGTPVAWFVGNHRDKKAKRESIKYTNVVPLGELSPKESVNVRTLVPMDTKPQLKLSIYSEKTKEYQSFIFN